MSDLRDAVRRVAAGDPRAFEPIVAATSDSLFRLAYRMLGSRAEAQDAVQEGYVRAFEALRQGRYDPEAPPEKWLYRVVVNLAIDQLRRRRSLPAPEAEPSSDPHEAERAVLRGELLQWLGALAPDQRAAVVLRYLEGLSNGEAAAVLGVSEGAVEQRLIRARAALRKRLDDER